MSEEILTKKFPITNRWVIKLIVPWILAFFLTLYMIYLFENMLGREFSDMVYRITFYLGLIAIIIRATYLILFKLNYDYKIVGDEIIVTRGVVLKKSIGFPIEKITAIHLARNLLDYFLGTSTVVLVVPGELKQSLSTISGMSTDTAEAFKKYIFEKN